MIARVPELRLFEGEIFVDGFAGGGGASTGIKAALGASPFLAINHDREALAMHNANHPETIHLRENITLVDPVTASAGRKVRGAWFSPDCTYHSKARGGAPFRDRNRARRVRGLAWVAVRWAKAVRPDVIFLENVEEWKDWGPLGKDGRPDPLKRGASFSRWVAQLRNIGYMVEWKELRACDFGAPTSRKRLFIIARCDGKPIVWPAPTHGKGRATPYRTAAECIDWSIPVPSIFLTTAEAKAWGIVNHQPAPKRPLAAATMTRIARGIDRYVINSADPFLVNVRHTGYKNDVRVYSANEPVRTIASSDREIALCVPTLVQTGYGERAGQQPRSLDIRAPLGTIVAGGAKHALVAAFLAKHNGGHEATGQRLRTPADTITTVDQKALVTSHLVKLRGGLFDHPDTSQDVRGLMPTLTAGGLHVAEVRAFLLKYYGTEQNPQLRMPLHAITTKERFALVTVTIAGEEYYIADIGMRMLSPRELYRAQGFPLDYKISHGIDIETGLSLRFTKKTQTRLVGNSVAPHVAAAIVSANIPAISRRIA